MIVWILLGVAVGAIASRILRMSGEGTLVAILIGIFGAVGGGGFFNLFGGSGMTGFNMESVYSAAVAAVGATICLALYHVFHGRRML